MKKNIKRVLAVALATMAIIFIAAVPAQATVYWNCTTGVACVWMDSNGNGTKATLAVGTYGYGVCHNFNSVWNDTISSVSADYGGGWDLMLYKDANCVPDGHFGLDYQMLSSGSKSFTGLVSRFNDEHSSFRIVQVS